MTRCGSAPGTGASKDFLGGSLNGLTLPEERRFTSAEWQAILADPVADKAYLAFQLGPAVAQWLSWKETEGNAAPATIREYEAPLAALCTKVDKPAGKITVQDLRAIRDTFVPSRHKAVTAAFRGCFQWLYEEGLIDSNPASRLRSPRSKPKAITDLYTDAEKASIVTAQRDPMDRAGVLLFFQAGLRKAELRNMRVRDVNLLERYVLVTQTKGGKFRRVPIRGSVVRTLDELFLTDVPGLGRSLALDEYVLAAWTNRHKARRNPSRPMSPRAAHYWWYQCLERAGIVDKGTTSGRRMHAARHTYATSLGKANGWNMLAIQKNLGHSSINVTVDTYTQFAYEDQEAAVDLLPDILEVAGE